MSNKYSALFKRREIWELLLTVILLIFFYTITGIGCPIRFFFGIPCLGCGMTRAVLAASHMDFSAACQYHPLCFLLPLWFVLFLKKTKINKRFYQCFCGVMVLLFVIVYLLRLCDPADEIVKINIKNGMVYQWVCNILKNG